MKLHSLLLPLALATGASAQDSEPVISRALDDVPLRGTTLVASGIGCWARACKAARWSCATIGAAAACCGWISRNITRARIHS